jgi:hypothetical protein
MKTIVSVTLIFLSGCAIADRSDKFGADLDVGIGGVFSYIADVHIKASVGFSKTCLEKENATSTDGGSGPGGSSRGFL